MAFSSTSTTRLGARLDPPEIASDPADVSRFTDDKGTTGQAAILIVDDDASVRRALHTTLETFGFRTSEASGGDEALALARAASYDIVLLDINMPGMDGLETCRRLRKLFPRIAILMLTVRDGEEDKVGALEAGADDYVTKPFHIRELVV